MIRNKLGVRSSLKTLCFFIGLSKNRLAHVERPASRSHSRGQRDRRDDAPRSRLLALLDGARHTGHVRLRSKPAGWLRHEPGGEGVPCVGVRPRRHRPGAAPRGEAARALAAYPARRLDRSPRLKAQAGEGELSALPERLANTVRDFSGTFRSKPCFSCPLCSQ